MKKIKTLIAMLLAFAFCGIFSACNAKENALSSTPSNFVDSSLTDDSITSSSSDSESMENDSSSSESPENNSSSSASSSSNSKDEEKDETPPVIVSKKAEYIRCTGNNVNIRSGAGTSYSVLGSAKQGTMYAVIEKKGDWYKTYYRNKVAYINASYATVISLEKNKDEDVENVLSEGYKLIGVPYVYGAVRLHDGSGKLLSKFTAQKFDCSSLVQYVFYYGADVLLDTTTRSQVVQGKYVSKSNLKRGDCLYFTNEDRQYKSGIERVGHVAIYLGNDYILHTASDYARIEKMSAQRWKFYIEARRFV